VVGAVAATAVVAEEPILVAAAEPTLAAVADCTWVAVTSAALSSVAVERGQPMATYLCPRCHHLEHRVGAA